MFSQAELRVLGAVAGVFLAGLGWKSVQASAPLPPLRVEGRILSWDEPAVASGEVETILPGPTSRRADRTPAKDPHFVLDANTASFEEFQKLPGIGPALARRLVEARSQTPFRTLADLDRVKGVGPAKLRLLATHLTF